MIVGRPMFPSELKIAWQVFRATLPYHKIYISPIIGLQRREFTTTVPPFTSGISPIAYMINVGWSGFYHGMAVTVDQRNTLVHELTHVWQGAHSLLSSSFMIESIAHQAAEWITGTDPYAYVSGGSWRSYNVEQQAHIVKDWYAGGAREVETDPLFRYIRDDIRSLLWFI